MTPAYVVPDAVVAPSRCSQISNLYQLLIRLAQVELVGTVIHDVYPRYNNMPFQHCVWSCRMMKRNGWTYAWKMGELKEKLDNLCADYGVALKQAGCWDQISKREQANIGLGARSADQPSDYRDNAAGRHCGDKCNEKSCEECCQESVARDAPEGPGTDRPFGPRTREFPEFDVWTHDDGFVPVHSRFQFLDNKN